MNLPLYVRSICWCSAHPYRHADTPTNYSNPLAYVSIKGEGEGEAYIHTRVDQDKSVELPYTSL